MAIVGVQLASQKCEVVVAKDFLQIKQLNVCPRVHICDHVVTLLKITATDLVELGCNLLNVGLQELERVAKDYVIASTRPGDIFSCLG